MICYSKHYLQVVGECHGEDVEHHDHADVFARQTSSGIGLLRILSSERLEKGTRPDRLIAPKRLFGVGHRFDSESPLVAKLLASLH